MAFSNLFGSGGGGSRLTAKLQLERLDERALMAADSFLSVVAPNGYLTTGAYTMPTGGIDPNFANQYVPIADLSFTLDGTTYSGSPSSGGPPPSPTQFQAQPTAHFQNGIFVGTNFAVVPVAGSGSGSTSGGGSTQHNNIAAVDGVELLRPTVPGRACPSSIPSRTSSTRRRSPTCRRRLSTTPSP